MAFIALQVYTGINEVFTKIKITIKCKYYHLTLVHLAAISSESLLCERKTLKRYDSCNIHCSQPARRQRATDSRQLTNNSPDEVQHRCYQTLKFPTAALSPLAASKKTICCRLAVAAAAAAAQCARDSVHVWSKLSGAVRSGLCSPSCSTESKTNKNNAVAPRERVRTAAWPRPLLSLLHRVSKGRPCHRRGQ